MLRIVAALAVVCSLGLAQQAPAPDKLPVRRVVLYKNGVGYFEHAGPVRDNQDVTISFTSGQLNDVLKSLTVLDLNGGRISAVGYESAAPVDRQLGDLRLPVGQKTTMLDFLDAIRGSRIEIKSNGTTLTGRLLSVERPARGTSDKQPNDVISLVTESGEVKTLELTPGFSVRLLERGLPGKVDRYLDLSSTPRDADVRRMVISDSGSGQRSLFLSYISEVPVWKATYRIVLDSKSGKGPLLQGWAIVDNTVGQDWDNVQLSLVAGSPQSFIQNLSQPLFTRRPEVPVAQAVNFRPQTFQPTLVAGQGEIAGTIRDQAGAVVTNASIRAIESNTGATFSARADIRGGYRIAVQPGTYRVEVQSPGFRTAVVANVIVGAGGVTRRDVTLSVGQSAEEVTVTAETSLLATESGEVSSGFDQLNRLGALSPSADAIGEVRARLEAAAVGGALGDLFEYKLKEPVTIERNKSALVPIIQSAIDAEKVSLWNNRMGNAHPLRALWLTNTTGSTLDGGSFNVLEEETFAGEGIFEPIHPGERRLVSYASDLALNASSEEKPEARRILRARITKGVLILESEQREKRTYTFRNEDSTPRTVIVEHPVRQAWELRGDLKPAETTSSFLRFRLTVDPKQTGSLVVEEGRPDSSTYAISGLSGDEVKVFEANGSIGPKTKAALQEIMALEDALKKLKDQKQALASERTRIFADQARIRENLKTVSDTQADPALAKRYAAQLAAQETRLAEIDTQSAALDPQIAAASDKVDQAINSLSLEEDL